MSHIYDALTFQRQIARFGAIVSLVTHRLALSSSLPFLSSYQNSEWADHLFLVSAFLSGCSLLSFAYCLLCHLKGDAFYFLDKTSHLKSAQLKSALTSPLYMCWQDHCPLTGCLFSCVIPLFYFLTSSSGDVTLFSILAPALGLSLFQSVFDFHSLKLLMAANEDHTSCWLLAWHIWHPYH